MAGWRSTRPAPTATITWENRPIPGPAGRITPEDFQRFDLIVAMDRANHEHLQSLCPPALQGKLRRMMEFATRHRLEEVPDPYYGGPDGFEQVLDLLEDAAAGLLEELTRRLDPCPAELPR
jgi:protein-tyrosine phosphatase